MDIVITQQDYEFFEETIFADYRPGARFSETPQQPDAREAPVFLNKENCTMLQVEYVRGFEDRISPYPELQSWLKRQRSKAFSYEETVLQCIFALEYGCLYGEQRTYMVRVWELLLTEAEMLLAVGLVLRCPSYCTFRKLVRDLDAALQSAASAL